MLNFDTGRAIGQVVDGKKNGEIIYLDESNSDYGYDKIKLSGNQKIIPIINTETRQVYYIAGPSGSGKSTYAAEQLKIFKKLYPKNNIFIFSRLEKDDVLDKLNPVRIVLDNTIIDDPIDIHNEFGEGDIILFDDCDTIQDKNLKDAISKLKNDILETGRHMNLHIIITSHLINGNDRKDTRTVLNEAHTLTIFPKSGAAYGIKYVLKNYIGLSKNQIEKIMSLPSRWVTINKNYPQYVIYEKGVYLLN